ncbi:hypothetical protein [Halovenus halobia]|uniref:hypothetical protein n=1 Tax=Halovenus halobia TaxID=3396622 RepID=UPI003F5460B2
MGRAESGRASTDVDEEQSGTQSTAYISPFVDFLVLFVLTAAAAATVLVVL